MTRGDLLFIRDVLEESLWRSGYEELVDAIRLVDKELDRLTEQPRTQADIGDEDEDSTYRY